MYDHKQSVKEVIRHVLFRCGLADTLDLLRHWRGQDTEHMRTQNLTDIFSHIYANDVWVAPGNQESLSGVGSTQGATGEFVVRLSAFLREVGCRQLVDIGCGDFNWMRNVQGDFDYLGVDVVPQVIDANNATYANDTRRFICMDATRTAINPGDVAVCREVLFHLSFRDGLQLLRNIKATGFKYVLLTYDKSVWFNSDIRSGDFRRINLSKSPFRFPAPQRELRDDKVSKGRVLAVWPGAVLPG
jgi:Methyltransferase domain